MYDHKEAIKGQSAMHIRNMQQIEEYFTLARQIKYIKSKFRKSGTTFVTQQQIDVSTLLITD